MTSGELVSLSGQQQCPIKNVGIGCDRGWALAAAASVTLPPHAPPELRQRPLSPSKLALPRGDLPQRALHPYHLQVLLKGIWEHRE